MKSLTESDVNRKNKLSVYACMRPQVWHEQERCGALLLLHALHGQQAAEDRGWWGASRSERCWMGGEWAGKNRVERWKSDRERERQGEEGRGKAAPITCLSRLLQAGGGGPYHTGWGGVPPGGGAPGGVRGHRRLFCHRRDAGSHVGLFFVGSACLVAGLDIKFSEVSRSK